MSGGNIILYALQEAGSSTLNRRCLGNISDRGFLDI